MRRARSFVASLVLALAGCLGAESKDRGRSIDHEELPNCWQRARFLEDRAVRTIRDAQAPRWGDKKKRELFDSALSDLREARDLYSDELEHEPGTPGKQRILRDEFERLSGEIDATYDARPPG